jgi:hypothetical protein
MDCDANIAFLLLVIHPMVVTEFVDCVVQVETVDEGGYALRVHGTP